MTVAVVVVAANGGAGAGAGCDARRLTCDEVERDGAELDHENLGALSLGPEIWGDGVLTASCSSALSALERPKTRRSKSVLESLSRAPLAASGRVNPSKVSRLPEPTLSSDKDSACNFFSCSLSIVVDSSLMRSMNCVNC